MATYTKNLNLVKPDINDPVSPKPFNENADILDERISSMAGSVGNKWEFIKEYPISLKYPTTSGFLYTNIAVESDISLFLPLYILLQL